MSSLFDVYICQNVYVDIVLSKRREHVHDEGTYSVGSKFELTISLW